MKKIFTNIFPIISSLKVYSKQKFRGDLSAGLTVGVMAVPQGMAYAALAGMPLIYGLYACIFPLLIYSFLGTSRQLSVGPVAVSGLLVLEGIRQIATPETPEYIGYVLATGFFTGILQALFGVFRMGFLVNFLSRPVLSGFTSAAAIIIIISQLKDFLGFPIERFSQSYETAIYALQNLDQTNLLSVFICVFSMLTILFFKKIHKAIPGALIVVIVGTLACWGFDFSDFGLNIVKDVPSGLPNFVLPDMSWTTLKLIFPTVLTVTIIGIVESISIAKGIELQHDDYTVKPNQELIAIGVSKIGGAFFQALPSSGSFTRSAVNNESGAKTNISSLVAMLVVVFTLLYFTPLFYYLPKAILAAIILLAVKSLFDYKEAIHLWKTHKRDFSLMLATFIITMIFGIEIGVLSGVILSVFSVLYRISRPHIAILGKVPGKTYYRNIERFEALETEDNTLIIRFDNQLFFANATFFKDEINSIIKEKKTKIKYLFIDAKSIHDIDSSGLHALQELHQSLEKREIELFFCGAIGPVRDRLKSSGLLEEIGEDHHFLSLHEAVEKGLRREG